MLLVAHRAPSCAVRCAELGGDGADVFEIDLQAHGDEVVVSHFLPITPLIPKLRHDRWAVRWGTVGRGADRLHAAVERFPAGSGILLDLKDDSGSRGAALVDLLLRSDLDPARCYVSTRQWPVLPALRRAGFRTWRTVAGPRALARVLDGAATPDDGVTVHYGLLRGRLVERLRRKAGHVTTWTVNDPDRAERLASWGVDGITSDLGRVFRRIRA